MLWNGFRLHLVGGSLLTALALWGMARLTRPWLERERSWSNIKLWVTWPVVVFVALFAIRLPASITVRPTRPCSR